MKTDIFFRKAVIVLCAFLVFSSCTACSAPETHISTAALTSAAESSPVSEIRNEQVGGLLLEPEVDADNTAVPIPLPVITEDDTYETTVTAAETTHPAEVTATSPAVSVTTSAVHTPAKGEQAPAGTRSATITTTSAPATTTTATTTTTAAVTTAAVTTAAVTTAAVTTTTETTTAMTTTAVSVTAAAAETTAPASGSYGRNTYKALNHSNVRAVWISYIEIAAHLSGRDETRFAAEFGKMLDNCESLGINTVYVHVRSHGDAYFYSELFPFTRQLTGTPDKRTAYDPLKVMVREAHEHGISFHAWINPLRLCANSEIMNVSEKYPVGKWYRGAENGTYIVNCNGTWFLNPAYDAVRQLIGDNVREIVSGYDVDGVHIDDYFYPTTAESFDSAAFAASGSSSLKAFRTANINAMVKEMFTAAHECGTAIFGAAPQGSDPNNLDVLFADTAAWCKGGYIDYFTPQIYYGFNNQLMPYKTVVDHWLTKVQGTSTKLIVGLSVYKCGNEDKWAGTGKTEWQNSSDILKRQVEYANLKNCSGVALYSYDYLFSADRRTAAMQTEINNMKPLLVG